MIIMDKLARWILRFGLAITFIWIGVFILNEPEAWGGYIKPWAMALLPAPLKEVMIGNAILDIAIGAGLLIGPFVLPAAALGAGHLFMVLAVSGVNEGTVRDIGLLGAAVCLAFDSLPLKYRFWIKK